MIENDPWVPADLRTRLEVARLENLVIMRTLDHALPIGTLIPRGEILAFGELDADCGEALWALDQPPKSLDVRAMVRDTLASLERLPAVRQHLRDLFLEYPLETEKEILHGLDPAEAYSQVPGRASTTRPPPPPPELRLGRNAPCPCGSGRKYEKCCLLSSAAAASTTVPMAQPALPRPRYHFKPGSYGGRESFMPSMVCEREERGGQRALHFVLVKPQSVYAEEDSAAAAAAVDLTAALSGTSGELAVPEQVVLRLRSAGYCKIDDPRMAKD